MNFRTLILLTACFIGVSAGQSVPPVSMPRPIPSQYDALKQFLVLTDAQVNSLTELQRSRQNAERAIYEQITERQRQIHQLLQSGSNDASTIGRLMVEVNNLQRQLPLSGNFRQTALNVLHQTQKTKLAELSRALELQRTAGEAVSLNLIDYPRVPQPRILPLPAEEPSVNVVSEP